MSREKGRGVVPSPMIGGSAMKALAQSEPSLKELIRQAVTEAINPIIARLSSLDEKIVICQNIGTSSLKKTAGLESSTRENKTEIKAVKKQMKSLEGQVIELQIEKAKTLLRIQNFPEEGGENLRQKLAEFLVQLAGKSDKELLHEIVAAFRVSSAYASKHSLPREIFVRPSSLIPRYDIMKKANGMQLKYKENEIMIQREIPFLVQKKRAKYKQLTALLFKKGVRYRYLIPEGLFFIFREQPIKITTEEQMQSFLTEHGVDLDFHPAQKGDGEEISTGVPADQTTILQKLRPRGKDPLKKK